MGAYRRSGPAPQVGGQGVGGALRLSVDPVQGQVVRGLARHRYAVVGEPAGARGVLAAVAYAAVHRARRDGADRVLVAAPSRVRSAVADDGTVFGDDVGVEVVGVGDLAGNLAALTQVDHVVMDTRWVWREALEKVVDVVRFCQEASACTYVLTDPGPRGRSLFGRLGWSTGSVVSPLRRVWVRAG